MAELVERVLNDGDVVPFTAMTPGAGRAMFRFCLRYVRGKLIEVVMTPMQQPAATELFRLAVFQPVFCANAWTYKGLDDPKVWRHFWCPEHRSPAFDLYVPRQATQFEVHGSDIYFGRGDG